MSFSTLGLSDPLLRILEEVGYTKPTPIQREAIPAVLAGRDVMAAAQTGTGKTAGFTLPMLQRLAGSAAGGGDRSNRIRALVLTPTRELAVQVAESVATYGRYLSLKSAVVYGGVKINPQMMALRGGTDVLVATPGRLLDLCSRNAVKLGGVEILVLDEADRMLDMGFNDEIDQILPLLPRGRQTLLFSATLSGQIRKLTEGLLKNPVRIEVNPPNAAAGGVKQWVYEVDKGKKAALLSHLIRNKRWEQVLVFVRTKKGGDRLVEKLVSDGVAAAAIHGEKSQSERSRALDDFKANRVRVLVATDIAARGIDIRELPHVINFDLPHVPEEYIHRIGRTGRAGLEGEGISLVSADEVRSLSAIEALLRRTLVREVATGFIPTHSVPLTRLSESGSKPKKPKKPKKPIPGNALKGQGEERRGGVKPRRSGRPSEAEKGRGEKGKKRRGSDNAPAKKRSPSKRRPGK